MIQTWQCHISTEKKLNKELTAMEKKKEQEADFSPRPKVEGK